MRRSRAVSAFALAAGLCDTATGVALIVAPLWTLEIMGIGVFPAEPVFQRWIGAFVFATGLSYLYPFLLAASGPSRFQARLETVFEMTALVRTAVALVVGGAIFVGALEIAWLGVPVFDATVAAAQLILLRRGWLREI